MSMVKKMNTQIINQTRTGQGSARLYRRIAPWGLIATLLLTLGAQGSVPAAAQPTADPQLAAMHPQAVTILYSYDAAGRLTIADYGSGNTLNYAYDATGNLANIAPWKMIYLPIVLRN